jgi:hypothetical protein
VKNTLFFIIGQVFQFVFGSTFVASSNQIGMTKSPVRKQHYPESERMAHVEQWQLVLFLLRSLNNHSQYTKFSTTGILPAIPCAACFFALSPFFPHQPSSVLFFRGC